MNQPWALLAVALMVSGCAGKAAAPPGAAAPPTAEEPLRLNLRGDPHSAAAVTALAALEAELGSATFTRRLGVVARDTSAPPLTRGNALLLLGDRRAQGELRAFEMGLRARDARVRAAAAVGLRGLLVGGGPEVTALLERALRDPDTNVQARALETLVDRDAAVLRRYLADARPRALRTVAEELLRVAEERGAPLEPDSAGVLARTTGTGMRLVFRPVRLWPQWEAAVGELAVSAPGLEPVVIADSVETVGHVVPAFFSLSGEYLVYESARQVRVRTLATGVDWVVGEGIAPRALPFTSEFVYLRERAGERVRRSESTGLVYDVLKAPFAGGAPQVIGRFEVTVRTNQRGGYSPVRWARVREQDGLFYLDAGAFSFTLPDPFSAAAPG